MVIQTSKIFKEIYNFLKRYELQIIKQKALLHR